MGMGHQNRMSRDVTLQFSENFVKAWYPNQGCQNRKKRQNFDEFLDTREQPRTQKVINRN